MLLIFLLYVLKNYVLKHSTLSSALLYLLYFHIFFGNNISKFFMTYFSALDNNVSIMFNLLFANAIILLRFFFLFLVTFSNDLFIPVPIVNIKVKE